MKARIALLCASTALCLGPGAAFAQTVAETLPAGQDQRDDQAAQVNDEIVVTARRQAENVQAVPISIVAIDNQALQERGIRTTNDLPQVAAGLSVQNTAARKDDTTFSIRGQGQTFGQSSPGVVA